MDKPTKTVRVSAGTRIYYFDAHKDKNGQPYISISEIPGGHNPGSHKRQRVFIHKEDIAKFACAFAEMVDHIEKNDIKR